LQANVATSIGGKLLSLLVSILTWHRNKTRSLAIADLIWYSFGE